jgi:hypothetical protein
VDATTGAAQQAEILAELRDREGLTTREIAARTGEMFSKPLSQTTVVRRLQLWDSGPLPVFREDRQPSPEPPSAPVQKNVLPLLLLAGFVLLALAAIAALTIARPTATPAVVCVRSAATGAITGLSVPHNSSCESGWQVMVLGTGN